MIRNVLAESEVVGLARVRRQPKEFVTVKPDEVDNYERKGWEVQRINKKTVRLFRKKRRAIWLEDRVWSLLYKMGFDCMSGAGGAQLSIKAGSAEGPTDQLDVVALDREVALAIECKSALEPRRRNQLQREIEHLAATRRRFANAIDQQFPTDPKRIPVQVFFLWDVLPHKRDMQAADNGSVRIFDINDLEYFEALVAHLGPAAKYQFLAELLAGHEIRGLEIRIPALRAKMGKLEYYMFALSPAYLLKVVSIAHRAGGHRAELGAYQRMLERNRLKKIASYISDHGVFPTNIVINFEGRKTVQFYHGEKEGDPEGARNGMLHIKPTYGCAWVIDGQHRLYAYSGHERADTSYLNVLAFENLPIEKQAELFIDINHEQKSVKRSLLQELFAVLKWSEVDEAEQVRAIISRAITQLSENPESPLFKRIRFTGQAHTDTRCITITSIFSSLNKSGMFVVKKNVEYGPLWAGDREETVKRTAAVLSKWLAFVQSGAFDWWELGAGDGGGLAMNDGVAMCISLLRSVFQHLESKGIRLPRLSVLELVSEIRPFGEEVGRYLGSLSLTDRHDIRDGLRGVQGQTAHRRQCEMHLRSKYPDFDPPGLEDYMALVDAETTTRAYALVSHIELLLKHLTVETLKRRHGEDAWWYEGIPEKVRMKASEMHEKAKGEGEREDYFDILDYQKIITGQDNWSTFQPLVGGGERGREKGTKWIIKVNEIRKVVMHPSKNLPVTFDQLGELREYERRLDEARLAARNPPSSDKGSDSG